MNINKFVKKYFDGKRAKCGKAMNTCYWQVSRLMGKNAEIVELKNGDWVTLHKLHKRIKREDML